MTAAHIERKSSQNAHLAARLEVVRAASVAVLMVALARLLGALLPVPIAAEGLRD